MVTLKIERGRFDVLIQWWLTFEDVETLLDFQDIVSGLTTNYLKVVKRCHMIGYQDMVTDGGLT